MVTQLYDQYEFQILHKRTEDKMTTLSSDRMRLHLLLATISEHCSMRMLPLPCPSLQTARV